MPNRPYDALYGASIIQNDSLTGLRCYEPDAGVQAGRRSRGAAAG
jgi:hypothetical protein